MLGKIGEFEDAEQPSAILNMCLVFGFESLLHNQYPLWRYQTFGMLCNLYIRSIFHWRTGWVKTGKNW